MKNEALVLLLWAALAGLFDPGRAAAQDGEVEAPKRTPFTWPCDGYLRGLRGRGNFGVLVRGDRNSPFAGTHHLAEDVWLAAGTEVRSVAGGRVVYSDFSPTWTDANGHTHWNLGNVIVIEHDPEPAEGKLEQVCSFYVHLSKERLVEVGDQVRRGQPIGFIGADRSEENGRYPEHLHFGIHQGPYRQLSPAWKRNLIRDAATSGLPVDDRATGKMKFVQGKIVEVKRIGDDTAAFRFESGEVSYMSLEVGSTAPGEKPADIMHWCEGYGDQQTVSEWLKPSEWIARHLPDER